MSGRESRPFILVMLLCVLTLVVIMDQYIALDAQRKIQQFHKISLDNRKIWIDDSKHRFDSADTFGIDSMVYAGEHNQNRKLKFAVAQEDIENSEKFMKEFTRENVHKMDKEIGNLEPQTFEEMSINDINGDGSIVQNIPSHYEAAVVSADDMLRDTRQLILYHDTDSLGAVISQYTSAWAIAKTSNRTLYISVNNPILQLFSNLKANIYKHDDSFKDIRHPVISGNGPYNHKIVQPFPESIIIKDGLQSFTYINPYIREIKDQLKFSGEIKDKVDTFFKPLRNGKQTISNPEQVVHIGVDFNMGLLTPQRHKLTDLHIPEMQYFYKSLEHFSKIFSTKQVKFIICSDSYFLVKKYFSVPNVISCPRDADDSLKLAILSNCNHMIMSVGPIGAWGGFLSGGTTIYYPHPFIEGSALWKTWRGHVHEKVPPIGARPYYWQI